MDNQNKDSQRHESMRLNARLGGEEKRQEAAVKGLNVPWIPYIHPLAIGVEALIWIANRLDPVGHIGRVWPC